MPLMITDTWRGVSQSTALRRGAPHRLARVCGIRPLPRTQGDCPTSREAVWR